MIYWIVKGILFSILLYPFYQKNQIKSIWIEDLPN